jgi:hypothetical protein
MASLKKIRRAFARLRPLEVIGLIFLIVMVCIYQWLDLPILYIRRIVPWAIIMLTAFTVATVTHIFLSVREAKQFFQPKKLLGFLRDWAPLFLCIVIYDNLHDITRYINPHDFDLLFITIDKILFFGNHPTVLLENVIRPHLTDWFGINYSMYFLYFPLTLGVLHASKQYKEFHIVSFSLLITLYAGFILYLLFPCVGPILSQHNLHTIDVQGTADFSFYNGAMELYGQYRNYFHCFPSLHIAATAVLWYFCWKYKRWLAVIYTPFILSLWFSTLYLRWHYVVDVIAGFVLAGYAVTLGPWIYEAWERWRKRHL